jgi:hypothetical protein
MDGRWRYIDKNEAYRPDESWVKRQRLQFGDSVFIAWHFMCPLFERDASKLSPSFPLDTAVPFSLFPLFNSIYLLYMIVRWFSWYKQEGVCGCKLESFYFVRWRKWGYGASSSLSLSIFLWTLVCVAPLPITHC